MEIIPIEMHQDLVREKDSSLLSARDQIETLEARIKELENELAKLRVFLSPETWTPVYKD